MTGNRCLLDTSVIVHAFRSNNSVGEKLDKYTDIYVPATVVGELYYGAYKSADKNKHITKMKSFLGNCTIIHMDDVTADFYGSIKATLMQQGKPIPENDIWIAAIALQYKLPLFTTDNHFTYIAGVQVI